MRDDLPGGYSGRGWWLRLGLVVLVSVVAVTLILFGAVRFLDQAEREHARGECVRVQVQAQAQGNAEMAGVVLDGSRTQAERASAVAAWRDSQRRIADALGRC